MIDFNQLKTNSFKNNDSILWDLWLSRLYLPIIAVADKINLFECINDGNSDIDVIAQNLKMDKLAVEALIYYLASISLLNSSNAKVSLSTTTIDYLLPNSNYYWGHAFIRAHESEDYKRILAVLSNEPTQLMAQGKNLTDMWKSADLSIEAAESFTKIMHSTIHPAAKLAVESNVFNGISHLLDVGGGSGCFAEEFVNHYPQSLATVFELPSVCNVITNKINNTRVNLHAGDFFVDDFPANCDGVLFSNIFHDWNIIVVKLLLEKTFKALPAGGRVFIHEMLLNEDKCGPVTATVFNLLMYINHSSQQFTQSELYKLLEDTGFKNCTHSKAHPYYSIITAKKP